MLRSARWGGVDRMLRSTRIPGLKPGGVVFALKCGRSGAPGPHIGGATWKIPPKKRPFAPERPHFSAKTTPPGFRPEVRVLRSVRILAQNPHLPVSGRKCGCSGAPSPPPSSACSGSPAYPPRPRAPDHQRYSLHLVIRITRSPLSTSCSGSPDQAITITNMANISNILSPDSK